MQGKQAKAVLRKQMNCQSMIEGCIILREIAASGSYVIEQPNEQGEAKHADGKGARWECRPG
jgi:hypothetical protein